MSSFCWCVLVCWFCKTFLTVVAAVQPGMVSTDIGHCFTLLTSFLVFCLLSVRLFWGLGLWRSDIYILVWYWVQLLERFTHRQAGGGGGGGGGGNLCVRARASMRVCRGGGWVFFVSRIGYATERALFISAWLSTDADSALRKVWVLIYIYIYM